MAKQRTLSILKPDATERNLTGKINAKFEENGLRIVAQKRLHLSRRQAGEFYGVHKERPFFGELVEFMVSGPVVVQVLEGDNAVAKNREIMGRHQPGQRRCRYHPQRIRRKHRTQQRPRFGFRRKRRQRNPLLLQRQRDCWLEGEAGLFARPLNPSAKGSYPIKFSVLPIAPD